MKNFNKLMNVKLSIILACLFFISGCVPSLNAFFTDKDIVLNPALIGNWIDVKNKYSCEFKQASEKEYELIIKEANSEAHFSAHLMNLNGTYFLDVYPEVKSYQNIYFLGAKAYFPMHNVAKVVINNDNLRISMLNPGTMENFIKDNKIVIPHEFVDGSIVLTAPTAELQDFLVHYNNEKGVFSVHYEFRRK